MIDSAQQASFATTRWSMVLAAGQPALPGRGQALAELCQSYWPAVYGFVRRRVPNVHEAQDLTQAFFAFLLEKNPLAVAEPARGRFRSFLLTAVQNFLHNQGDRARAEKRGGVRAQLAMDFQQADSTLSLEPADLQTPERIFERQWVLALLERVMHQLRSEQAAAGKEQAFDLLKNHIGGRIAESSLADVAQQLSMTENAVKVAAHRLRNRYRVLLRGEVAQTVADPADVDNEIRQLFAVLQG